MSDGEPPESALELVVVHHRLVAKLGKVSPDAQQRLLRRILGESDVAQNPVRHGKEPITEPGSEAREGLTFSAPRSFHEIDIHAYAYGPSRSRILHFVVKREGPRHVPRPLRCLSARFGDYGTLMDWTIAAMVAASAASFVPASLEK